MIEEFKQNDEDSSQQLHQEQSLWLKSPNQSRIENLNKRLEDSCSIDTSQTDMNEPLSSKKQSFRKTESKKDEIVDNESQISSILQKSQKNPKLNTEGNYTFRNNFRARELSIEKQNDLIQNQMDSSMTESMMRSAALSPLKRGESNKRLNVKSQNVQKELMNRFMQIYQKNKFQATKLDVIVKIKSRLKYFFRNYTFMGRSYILNDNLAIRHFVNDKSDHIFENNIEKEKTKQMKNGTRQISIVDQESKQNYFELFFQFVGQHINRTSQKIKQIKVIKPHYDWVITLNIIFIILNYIYFYTLSLLAAFDSLIPVSHSTLSYYNTFTMLQWFLEILIKLNTQTYFGGQYINNRKIILKLYLKGSFTCDIIPLILIALKLHETFFQKIIRLFLFIKLVNTIKEQRDVEKILLMRIHHHYYIDMFNLIFNVHVVGHLIALGYYVLSLIEENYLGYEKTWKNNVFECEGEWWRLYLESMFWAFTLMTTGSNNGTTMPEVLYVTAIMMLVFVLFGYIINMIGFIIVEMLKTSDDKKKDINVINNYMNRKHTSKELKHKVNLDLEYFYKRSVSKKSDDEQLVLGKISGELSDAIQLEYNKKLISKIKFLTKNFSQFVLDQLCVQLEESFYSPSQTIFKEDPLQIDPPIIFLISGKAEIMKQVKINNESYFQEKRNQKRRKDINLSQYANSQRKIIDSKDEDSDTKDGFLQVVGSLKKGQAFGEESFFTGKTNPYEIIASDFSTVLKLERSSFLKILKESEKDFQIFNEIKDKAIFMSDFQAIGLKCKICKSFSHQEINCPQCHHNRENQLLFYKLNKNYVQERQDFERGLKEKFNPLNDMIIILRDVEKIIDQLEIDTLDDDLYETLEINEFSAVQDSQEFKVSVDSITDEKMDKDNPSNLKNTQQMLTQQMITQPSQQVLRQSGQKLSINPVKYEQERLGGGSMTDIIEKNPSYLSANMYSRQIEDESNYSNYNQVQQKRGSFIVGSHLQPISFKSSQLEMPTIQQPQGHREFQKEKSLTSIKERDLHSQISQMDRKSRGAMGQSIQTSLLEELQKLYIQFTMMQGQNKRLSFIQSPSKVSRSKNTAMEKQGTIYEQQLFAEERSKQDQYWLFEQLQDYTYYFPDYNHSLILARFGNLRKRFQRDRGLSQVERKETTKRFINTHTQKTFL